MLPIVRPVVSSRSQLFVCLSRSDAPTGSYWSKLQTDSVSGEDEQLLSELFCVSPAVPIQPVAASTLAQPRPKQTSLLAVSPPSTGGLAPSRSSGATASSSSGSSLGSSTESARTPPPFSPQLPDEFPTPRSYSPSNSRSVLQHHSTSSALGPRGILKTTIHASTMESASRRPPSPLSVEAEANQRRQSIGAAPTVVPPVADEPSPSFQAPKLVISTSPASAAAAPSTRSALGSTRALAGVQPRPTPPSSQPTSRRGSLESDNLRLPGTLPSPVAAPSPVVERVALQVSAETPRTPKRTLGEMLTQSKGQSRTPSSRSQTLRPEEMRRYSGAGPELYSRGRSLAHEKATFRVSTPQPPSRTLGLHPEIKIDSDLQPKFAFLQSNKPLMAAALPLPSPARTPVNSGRSIGSPAGMKGFSKSPRTIPKNLEIGAMHAHAGSPTRVSGVGTSTRALYHAPPPRHWEVSPGAVVQQPRSQSPSRSSRPVTPSAIPSHSGASELRSSSPTNALSPVLLGSGVLADVQSTCARVVEAMESDGGVVRIDDDAIVDLVSKHRHVFARAAQHADGTFVLQLMHRKYNSKDKLVMEEPKLASRNEDAAKVLPADSMRVAVPFAPAEWFYSPNNLPLVLSYHLVLQALDFGLADVPTPPPSTIAPAVALLPEGTDPRDAGAAIAAANEAAARAAGPPAPYGSADLARALATVARGNPHAFDADRLSKMDAVRLGSWLQPHVFAQALEEHPELLDDPTLMSSPTSLRNAIPFTYPNLEERARILREIGFVLLRFFNGSVTKLLERCEHSACRMVELLTQHFPNLRDAAVYRGRFVYFYTRAQTFVRNVWIAFHGHALGYFHDIDELAPRSDAHLPPLLHAMGMLKYSRELQSHLQQRSDFTLLPPDMEVELRCASAHVVRRISTVLNNLDITATPVQLGTRLSQHSRTALGCRLERRNHNLRSRCFSLLAPSLSLFLSLTRFVFQTCGCARTTTPPRTRSNDFGWSAMTMTTMIHNFNCEGMTDYPMPYRSCHVITHQACGIRISQRR